MYSIRQVRRLGKAYPEAEWKAMSRTQFRMEE